MSLDVHTQQAPRDELAEHAPPGRRVQLRADAERADRIVAEAADTFVVLPEQHIDQVHDAKALTGAMHARERLLGDHRRVPGFRLGEAGVAVAAGLRQRLAEVGQQRLPAAAREFAQAQHRIQLVPLDALVRVVRPGLRQHPSQQDHVLQAVAHPGVGRQTIATGTARLLVVGFDALRQRQVRHETHVGLVDTHAEGDGRHHHQAFFMDEAALVGESYFGTQPCVIGQRRHALRTQPLRHVFRLLPG